MKSYRRWASRRTAPRQDFRRGLRSASRRWELFAGTPNVVIVKLSLLVAAESDPAIMLLGATCAFPTGRGAGERQRCREVEEGHARGAWRTPDLRRNGEGAVGEVRLQSQ